MFIMMYLTMTLLQDLASVVLEQGDIVDSIVSNIESTCSPAGSLSWGACCERN